MITFETLIASPGFQDQSALIRSFLSNDASCYALGQVSKAFRRFPSHDATNAL